MEFSRQEHWSGLPFLSPGVLPNPGIKPGSPTLQADSLPSEPPRKPKAKKGNIKLLRNKTHSNLTGRYNQISRDRSLEPALCAVPRSIVWETCWLFIYSLSTSDLLFSLHSQLWCSGWFSANHLSEAPWPVGVCYVLPVGGTRGRLKVQIRTNGTWFLLLLHHFSSGTWLQLPVSVSPWNFYQPHCAPSWIWWETGQWTLLRGLSTDSWDLSSEFLGLEIVAIS